MIFQLVEEELCMFQGDELGSLSRYRRDAQDSQFDPELQRDVALPVKGNVRVLLCSSPLK